MTILFDEMFGVGCGEVSLSKNSHDLDSFSLYDTSCFGFNYLIQNYSSMLEYDIALTKLRLFLRESHKDTVFLGSVVINCTWVNVEFGSSLGFYKDLIEDALNLEGIIFTGGSGSCSFVNDYVKVSSSDHGVIITIEGRKASNGFSIRKALVEGGADLISFDDGVSLNTTLECRVLDLVLSGVKLDVICGVLDIRRRDLHTWLYLGLSEKYYREHGGKHDAELDVNVELVEILMFVLNLKNKREYFWVC